MIKDKLIELKEKIKHNHDWLWDMEGSESYCELLSELLPMVDEILGYVDKYEIGGELDEKRN